MTSPHHAREPEPALDEAAAALPDAQAFAFYEGEPCDELPLGTVVAEKYRVKGVLGRGGFAVVYDAEHIALCRPVALKVLHRSQGTPHMLIERFAREVRISALVRHPNVLEVHDAGTLPDGSPFLVMEKIAGLTLYEKMCMEQRLGIDECLEIFGQLLDALKALALRGIVHRDIKPENLMLTRTAQGEVQLKLVDFGIALVRDERIEPRLTLQGSLVGTPHYMAPEQLRCDVVDARVDLYATGVVMYQALTGKLPFDGSTLSALTSNVLTGKATALELLRPDCPEPLARLVERALARDPEQRFASASEMLDALELCRDGLRVSITIAPPLTRVLRRMSRPRELGITAVLLVLAMLAPEQVSFASALRTAFPRVFPAQELVASTPLSNRAQEQAAPPETMLAASVAVEAPRAAPVLSSPAEGAPRVVHESKAEALPVQRAATAPLPRSPRASELTAPTTGSSLSKARALSQRGLALYLHGELDAAYAVYRQASLLSPNEASAFRGLGLCASRLGRSGEARRAFARYLELAEAAPDAHLIRARLTALRNQP